MGRKVFDTPFGNGTDMLPVEEGKYRLIWCHECPWSQRQRITMKLLGLDRVISCGTVSPVWTMEHQWNFSHKEGGVDPVLKIHDLKEAYDAADPSYEGEVIVPTLVDIGSGKAVNNDHLKMMGYWEKEWKPFHGNDAPDLCPQEQQKEIRELQGEIERTLLPAGFRAAVAQTQEEYDRVYDSYYGLLDRLEKRLEKSRFLFGSHVTEADITFYVFLIRYDLAYYGMGMNRSLLSSFKNLSDYARELYHVPAFRETTFLADIKEGVQKMDIRSNPRQIVTKGPDMSAWEEPVSRASLSDDPENMFLRR